MDSQSTPRSSVSSSSPARRDLRSLVHPPPRTPASLPSGDGAHAPPTGVGSARHPGPSPLVSSGSGGSRSSTRRESPVPCLDADQRVQAHALLQLVNLHCTSLRLFSGVDDSHGGANGNRFHTELLQEGPDPNNLDNPLGHLFFRMDEKLTTLAYPCRRFSFNLLNRLTLAACVKLLYWVPGILSWRSDGSKFGHSTLAVSTYHIPRIKGISYSGGSMASVALIRGNQIIVRSVGDSRCVLSRNGQVIEIPRGMKVNYELDKGTGLIKGDKDDKIIAVCADDPEHRHFRDISELPKHRLQEIRGFFEDYKNESVAVNDFLPAEDAIRASSIQWTTQPCYWFSSSLLPRFLLLLRPNNLCHKSLR